MRPFLIGLFTALVLAAASDPAAAQARTHAYGELGVGPAELNGGVDWLIGDRRVGLQAELGIFAVSLGVSYHLATPRPSDGLDLFVHAGYLAFTDLNFEDVGVNLGGGLVYWLGRHAGLRLVGFGFAPVKDRIRERHHHWGLRAGLAVSW